MRDHSTTVIDRVGVHTVVVLKVLLSSCYCTVLHCYYIHIHSLVVIQNNQQQPEDNLYSTSVSFQVTKGGRASSIYIVIENQKTLH
jgi:hypothetical protein